MQFYDSEELIKITIAKPTRKKCSFIGVRPNHFRTFYKLHGFLRTSRPSPVLVSARTLPGTSLPIHWPFGSPWSILGIYLPS
jgi:hypothetical protein